MSNEYYNPTGVPGTKSFGASRPQRTQWDLVEAGFDLLPTLSGNNDEVVFVNSAASGLEAVTAATARTRLGLVIGTDVQAFSSVLENTTASFTTALDTQIDDLETRLTTAEATIVDLQAQLDALGLRVVSVSPSGGTLTLNLSSGSSFVATLNSSVTVAVTNASASFGGEFSLTVDSTSGATISAITMSGHTVYVGTGDAVDNDIVLPASSRSVLGFVYNLNTLSVFVRQTETLT